MGLNSLDASWPVYLPGICNLLLYFVNFFQLHPIPDPYHRQQQQQDQYNDQYHRFFGECNGHSKLLWFGDLWSFANMGTAAPLYLITGITIA